MPVASRLRRTSRGTSFLELLISLAVISIFIAVTLPSLGSFAHRRAILSDADRIQSLMRLTQLRAAEQSHSMAIRFYFDGATWQYAIYADSNGNGVNNSEILSGVDKRVDPLQKLLTGPTMCHVGLTAGVTDPDDLKPIPATTSPLAFNGSMLLSFSPDGSGTPGSVFLTDNGSEAALVRSSGASGRIRKLLYNGPGKAWIEP